MKKALAIFTLSLFFNNFSHAVVITLANAQVLTQRLKALNSDEIAVVIEETDLIKQLAGKCYDTSSLLMHVKNSISDYIDFIKLDGYVIKIIEVLLQDSPEALGEFTRYYKISSYRSCRIS